MLQRLIRAPFNHRIPGGQSARSSAVASIPRLKSSLCDSEPPRPLLLGLSFAIIPSACNRLTWKTMKTNNRDTCQASFCLFFDSFDS